MSGWSLSDGRFFLCGFQAFGLECNTKWATAKMRWGDLGYFHGRPGSAREQTWVCPRADMGLFFSGVRIA